ncbi:Polysaccharide biosynthesis protein CapD [uncultured Spirochaetota bacterium]|nr:Polysaccharide biosynthesis protein CapD [uncultured Spirochaetota bacterium]
MKRRSNRRMRQLVLIAADIFCSFLSIILSSYIATESLEEVFAHLPALGVMVGFQILVLWLAKVYAIRLLDSSLELALRGQAALTFSGFVILIALLAYTRDVSQAFRFFVPYYLGASVSILGYRIAYRMALTYHFNRSNEEGYPRTLVYGAGEIGVQLAHYFFKRKLPYYIVGFIDDDPVKRGTLIQGLPVLGTLDDIDKVMRDHRIQALIIAITNLKADNLQVALKSAKDKGAQVHIVPSVFEMERYHKESVDIRSINYDDFLGRTPITIDRLPIEAMVRDRTVLVTGAGGSIGNEICTQLLDYQPKRLLLLDIDETELHDLSLRLHGYTTEFSERIVPIVCDVRDGKKVGEIFARYTPELVFHAAAYKHVPMMEYYPEEAVRTNILGTYNVFSSAVANKADRCILISSDKAVNPTNVMGATKRVAEQISSMLSSPRTEIVCVRFGNVLGSRGSMLPLFMEQIKNGLPITVTDTRIIRYFMTISEAVSLVFLAGAVAKGGEVMVLEMGEPVNIYQFAERLIQYYGDERSRIVVTGLRPGEKLYEERLSDKDTTIPTNNPKLFKAKVNGDLNGHRGILERFVKEQGDAAAMSPGEMVAMLKQLVPEYRSTNGV